MKRLLHTNIFTTCFVLAYFLFSFAIVFLLAMLHVSGITASALATLLLYVLAFGLPSVIDYIALRPYTGETPAQFFGFRRLSGRVFWLVFACAILVQPVMMLISSVSQLIFQNVTSDTMYQMAEMPLPLLLLTSAVFPAFFEELVCRGVLLRGYRETPTWYALLIPAVFFGLLHLNFQQALYAIAGGIFFALLVRFTGSLWSSIIAHFVINGLQSFLSWAVLHSGLYELSELTAQTELISGPAMVLAQLFAPALLTALTLPVLILCLIVLKKQSVPAYPSAKRSSFAGPPLLPTWHKGAWLMYINLGFLLIYCVINEVAFV